MSSTSLKSTRFIFPLKDNLVKEFNSTFKPDCVKSSRYHVLNVIRTNKTLIYDQINEKNNVIKLDFSIGPITNIETSLIIKNNKNLSFSIKPAIKSKDGELMFFRDKDTKIYYITNYKVINSNTKYILEIGTADSCTFMTIPNNKQFGKIQLTNWNNTKKTLEITVQIALLNAFERFVNNNT